MQAIAEQSNKEVKAEEMKTETPVVATSAGVTPAYVEEVAADLSKDRKG